MEKRALIVDDDEEVRSAVSRVLRGADWRVSAAASGAEAREIQTRRVHQVVLLDLDLPDVDGLELLPGLLSLDGECCIVVLTGDDRIPTAVEAMQLGAENFLTKPVDARHLRLAAERALEKVKLVRRARLARRERLRGRMGNPTEELSIGGAGDDLMRFAEGDSTILLTGETGVGKGWAAEAVHRLSPRSEGPLLEVNCAALSPELLESELFGHEAGAFTGAQRRKPGLFELADGGTLFLDEIDSLAPALQPKLLKVLETKRFRRVGGTEELGVDVRILAATNRELERAIEEGGFRKDLYYRLAVAPIHIPPLRERAPDEVLAIARRILGWLSADMGRDPPVSLDEGAARLILRYPWPGNIRELKNVLERTLLLNRDVDVLGPPHLPAGLAEGVLPGAPPASDGVATLEEVEREHLRKILRHHDGNRTRAAETLGISRAGLYKKLERHGLSDEV